MSTRLTLLTFILLLNLSAQAKFFERKIHTIEGREVVNYNSSWISLGRTEEDSVKKLVNLLKKSKTGRSILLKAQKKASSYNASLLDILKVGEGSLTDTTLVRKFSPSRPSEISYESRSKVYINKSLSVSNALLDMAHELTHFVYREPFNPYRENFSLKDFISSTVEGRGGEVDAYLVECRVYDELFRHEQKTKSHCHKVKNLNSGQLSRKKGVQEFYKVGEYISEFQKKMKEYRVPASNFSDISKKEAQFVSSAYGLPYPVAAIREFELIMTKVCANDKKRLALLHSKINQAKKQRRPASLTDQNTYQSMSHSFQTRCSEHI